MPLIPAGIHFLPTRTDDTLPLADRSKYIKLVILHATPENIIRNFLVQPSSHPSAPRGSNRLSTVRTRINIGAFASHNLTATLPLRSGRASPTRVFILTDCSTNDSSTLFPQALHPAVEKPDARTTRGSRHGILHFKSGNELHGNPAASGALWRPLISILKARRKNALDIKNFVPGHGPMGKPGAFDKLIAYLWWLLRKVDEAIRLGLTSKRWQRLAQRVDFRIVEILVLEGTQHLDAGMNVSFRRPTSGMFIGEAAASLGFTCMIPIAPPGLGGFGPELTPDIPAPSS